MFERATRDQFADVIESFLRGELDGVQLDDRVCDVWDSTKDETVQEICSWLFDADLPRPGDEAFSKITWDAVQRILLVLRSNADVKMRSEYFWSWSQLIAVVALGAFIIAAFKVGWSGNLVVVAMVFGLLSVWLDRWRWRLRRPTMTSKISLFPFASIRELVAARRSAPSFRKARFPFKPSINFGSNAWRTRLGLGLQYAFWLIYSPVVLLTQTFPIRALHARVLIDRNGDAT